MKRKLILLTIILVLTCSACSSNKNSKTPSDNPSGTEAASLTEATATEQDLKALAEKAMPLNKELTLDSWKLKTTGHAITDYISVTDDTGFEPNAGYQFYTIDVTAENSGKEKATFLPSLGTSSNIMADLYIGEDIYHATKLVNYKEGLHDVDLTPSEAVSGKLVYMVPAGTADNEDEILLVFEAAGEKVVYKLN